MLSPAVDRLPLVADAAHAAFDFDGLRRREFARLDAQGQCYLDYTGSALYGVSQVQAHLRLLEGGLFGNPHSGSSPSLASTRVIEHAREAVLRFLDVDASTHVVCFTANASAAIKLVAESYPFDTGSQLLLSADNHNSVNGIREYARAAGSAVRILPLDASLELDDPDQVLRDAAKSGPGLLAFPAQSNFSGVRHPLGLVRRAQALGFDVLLDCAAFAPSHPLSLRECPADFAVLSFYKLFGYPTGIGALVMRRESMRRLRRPWFAGGTVRYASVLSGTHRLHDGAERFEDGTADFLGIAALAAGFGLLEQVGMARLRQHVGSLTAELFAALEGLRHAGGAPMIRVYGPDRSRARGGTLAFNVLDSRGRVLPCEQVEAAARSAGICVRSGCFCNPGASEAAFGADPARLMHCLRQLDEAFTPSGLSACTGTAVGAVRASVGLANNSADLATLVGLLSGLGADTGS